MGHGEENGEELAIEGEAGIEEDREDLGDTEGNIPSKRSACSAILAR